MKHTCFKPYKGVSSNIMKIIELKIEERFKPYKGVSSNIKNNLKNDPENTFQTL